MRKGDQKMKRFKEGIVGFIIGSILCSSIVYATSNIEVNFLPLKYYFDGIEKNPSQDLQGFIYRNRTYVPLRFIAESLGKEVIWEDETKSILIGKVPENVLDNNDQNIEKTHVNPLKFNQHLQSLLDEGQKVITGEQVLKYGEWIYYVDYSKGMKLYKMKSDATNQTKLEDRFVASFCIIDDWIYYTVKVDGSQVINVDIYKMKLDGTSKTQIVQGNWIRSFYVVGNSIIYMEESQSARDGDEVIEPWTRKLRSINIDGTEKKLLGDNNLYVDAIQDGWVYYHNQIDNENFRYIYRTNGIESIQLNKEMSYNIQVHGEWIYYTNRKICKIRANGTEKTVFPIEGVDKMIVKNDWIYYLTYMGGLYKVKADGADNYQLAEGVEHLIGVAGDWIFYEDKLGNMKRIHRSKLINQIF